MNRYFIISNIEWDTDGENIKNLPNEMGLTLTPEDYEDKEMEEIEENMIEFLSEEYGWCICDYSVKEVNENGEE